MIKKEHRRRDWPLVTATVLEGGKGTPPGEFAYLVEGGRQVRAITETSHKRPVGSNFNLRYDPDDPIVIHRPAGLVLQVLSAFVASASASAAVAGWGAWGVWVILAA